MSESSVEVKHLGQKGRGLFARRPFKEDELVFEESPFVSSQFSWNQFYGYAACHHCMRPLEKTEDNMKRLTGFPNLEMIYREACPIVVEDHIKCPNCFVKYCSQKCFLTGQPLHVTYCDQRGTCNDSNDNIFCLLDEKWRTMHLPPETASINIIVRILSILNDSESQHISRNRLLNYCHDAIDASSKLAHKLLGDQFVYQVETLRQLIIAAFGENTENIKDFLSPEGFLRIWAILGRNSQGIGTSPISEWVRNAEKINKTENEANAFDNFVDDMYEKMSEESGMFWNTEGSGLFDLQSKINHSCNPNVEITFPYNNHTLVVKALSDIKEGEELTINYLEDCDRNRSRHSRQKILQSNYLFNCRCTKCEEQICDMDVTSCSEDDDEDLED